MSSGSMVEAERPLNRLLAKLDKATDLKNGSYEALCPAHDDHRPSLYVTELRDGKVLLKCRAGCTQAEVVAALGLRMADLFPKREWAGSRNGQTTDQLEASNAALLSQRMSGTSGRRVTASYEYRDESGTLLYTVLRYEPKDFRQRAADGSWSIKGVRRALYRLPEVIASVAQGEPVFVVEGEKDVDRLRGEGLAATCNSGGAGKWPDDPQLHRHFSGADVVILPDADEPGARHAEDVARKLAPFARSVRIVPLPNGKDASDYLANGGTVTELCRLPGTVPVWTPIEDALDDFVPKHEPYFTSLATLKQNADLLRPPRAVVPRVAWRGRVTAFISREKLGKTTYIGAGTAAASTGGLFLDEPTEQGDVLWIGTDEAAGETVRRFAAFGAEPDRVHLLTRRPPPEEIVAVVRAEVERLRPAVVVIDTLATFASGLVSDFNDATKYTPLMDGLAQIARAFDCALILLHHAKKEGSEYRDSTAIGAGVDMILTMTGKPDESKRRVTALGRFPLDSYTVRLDGTRYLLAGSGEDTLETRVLDWLRRNGDGSSTKAVADGVGANKQQVQRTLEHLKFTSLVVDEGSESAGHRWKMAPVEPSPTLLTPPPSTLSPSVLADIEVDRARIRALKAADEAANS